MNRLSEEQSHDYRCADRAAHDACAYRSARAARNACAYRAAHNPRSYSTAVGRAHCTQPTRQDFRVGVHR